MLPDSARYLRPTELSAALASLSAVPRVVLAGGTDLYATGTPRPLKLQQAVLDITAIESLRGMRVDPSGVSIGACTTWAQIRDAPLPPWLRGLRQSAAQVGGEQVQNVATVAGNLCNASPAADGVPPLLALSARIELGSARARRSLALEQFILGARRTACAADELVLSVQIPARSARARSVFHKLGSRSYLVISIVALAATLDFDPQGRICYAGFAVGACSACARRLAALESRLIGMDRAAARALQMPIDAPELSPIDDIRGSAAYRHQAVSVLVRRALSELCDG